MSQLIRKVNFLNKQKLRLLGDLPYVDSDITVRKMTSKINKLDRQINKLNGKINRG